MTALFVIILIVAVVVDYFVAMEFRNIAAMKGYDESKYFWYSFLLNVAGYLMVVALPTNTTASKKTETSDSKTEETSTGDDLPEI
jgi:hypothetical protein